MNDFDYEVKQKKDIARSAAHRVCGSKSTKCDLPSDHLTEAQKRALSGPVESYHLRGPMRWEEFKRLPDDLKRQYIIYLKTDYSASDAMLGRMFGVSEVTVNKIRSTLGVKALSSHYRPTREVKAAWNEFIGAKKTEATEKTETAAETQASEPVNFTKVTSWEALAEALAGISQQDTTPAREEKPVVLNPLQQFSAEFLDIRSWEEFYAAVKQFPAPEEGSFIYLRVGTKKV